MKKIVKSHMRKGKKVRSYMRECGANKATVKKVKMRMTVGKEELEGKEGSPYSGLSDSRTKKKKANCSMSKKKSYVRMSQKGSKSKAGDTRRNS